MLEVLLDQRWRTEHGDVPSIKRHCSLPYCHFALRTTQPGNYQCVHAGTYKLIASTTTTCRGGETGNS